MIPSKRYPELASCESTQDEVRKILKTLAPNNTDLHWLTCAQQTKGRGRQGSVWQSSTDSNAYLTTSVGLLNPAFDPLGPMLSLVAGHALYQALERFKLKQDSGIYLKWPNDIFAHHGDPATGSVKIAGILSERRSKQGTVIGFGVNLLWSPALIDKQTGHLSSYIDAVNSNTVREDLLAELIKAFTALLNEYLENPATFSECMIDRLQTNSMQKFLQLPQAIVSGRRIKPLTLNGDGSLQALDLQNQTTTTFR